MQYRRLFLTVWRGRKGAPAQGRSSLSGLLLPYTGAYRQDQDYGPACSSLRPSASGSAAASDEYDNHYAQKQSRCQNNAQHRGKDPAPAVLLLMGRLLLRRIIEILFLL